ncbi:MAG: MFS transporter [Sphaerochaetaceae bacterium]
MKFTNPLSLYKGLPSGIYVLSFATIINGIGIFVYPFLTLYLTLKLGYSASRAGVFMTVATTLYIPGSFLGSKLADSIGRKKVMVFSQLCMAFFYFLCGCHEGQGTIPYLVLCALFFDGVTDPAREALKIDITSMENRQVSFSLIYLAHNLGYAIGPVIGGLLFLSAPRWLFWGNAIAQVLAVIPILLKIKETKPSKEEIAISIKSNSSDKAEEGGILKALLSRPLILLFAVAMTFFTFGYSQTLFGLPLFTTQLFQDKGATLYGSIMAFNALLVVLLTPSIVSATRKRHPLFNVVLAGLLFALGFGLFAFSTVPWQFYVCCAIFTFGEVLWATNGNYYIANNTPKSHRARFNAVLPIIEGTGHAIAPTVGGLIIDQLSMNWLWLSSSLAALLGTLLVLFLYGKEKAKKKDKET